MRAVVPRWIAVGIGSGLLGLMISALPFGRLIDLKGYDFFEGLRSPGTPPADLVIVAVDEPSLAQLSLQWPWPRRVHSQVVDALAAEGATVIAFDILFAEPSNDVDDEAFADAMRRAGNVVLASTIEFLDDSRSSGSMLVEPLPRFSEVAVSGTADIPLDPDFVSRRFPDAESETPSFGQQVVRVHTGALIDLPESGSIRYAGPQGTVDTVSYYQVLNPKEYLPSGFFEGKIVLIGRKLNTSAEPMRRMPDMYATPFLFAEGGGLMSGVEIQANMVNGLVHGDYSRRVEGGWFAGIVLALGLVGSALQRRWSPWGSFLRALFSLVVLLGIGFLLFRVFGLWIPSLAGTVALTVPFGWFGTEAYLVSEHSRRATRRAFSHYVSPSVLADILETPDKLVLGGRRADVTVLFADIVGFSGLSENIAPEEVARFLNHYFTEMTAIVFAHGGTVDKFVGDALIAYWGAPLEDPEHALNACRAAIAMQERLVNLRQEMESDGLPEPWIRIGLNTGEVVVGNMGSKTLFNYTVLGDTVNLAARLEAANKEHGTSILISRAVVDQAGGSLSVLPLGTISVRGRTAPLEIFELTGAPASGEAGD